MEKRGEERRRVCEMPLALASQSSSSRSAPLTVFLGAKIVSGRDLPLILGPKRDGLVQMHRDSHLSDRRVPPAGPARRLNCVLAKLCSGEPARGLSSPSSAFLGAKIVSGRDLAQVLSQKRDGFPLAHREWRSVSVSVRGVHAPSGRATVDCGVSQQR